MSIDVAPAVGSHSRGTGKFAGGVGGGGGGGDGGDGAAVREAGRGTPAGLAAGAGASVLESAAPAQSLLSSMALRSESLLTVSATSRANGERTPSEPLLSSPSARQVDGDEDSARDIDRRIKRPRVSLSPATKARDNRGEQEQDGEISGTDLSSNKDEDADEDDGDEDGSDEDDFTVWAQKRKTY